MALTKKRKAMADIYLGDTKVTKKKAYMMTHDVREGTKDESVQAQAIATFRKPEVMAYLADKSSIAQEGIVEIAEYSKKLGAEKTGAGGQGAAYANVGLHAYKDILDRVHGKATQQIQVQSQHVAISIDLTGQMGIDQAKAEQADNS